MAAIDPLAEHMMDRPEHSHLARIANCLQTILDLEPVIEKLELGKSLLEEFGVLKDFLKRIDTVSLCEDDVERVESATASFLEELRGPLATVRRAGPLSGRMQ